jgi:alcohol dehydrogenase class IV
VSPSRPSRMWKRCSVSRSRPSLPDAILSIGGGSVLDAAKLFAVRLTNEEPLRQWLGVDLIKRPACRWCWCRPPPVPVRKSPPTPSSPCPTKN